MKEKDKRKRKPLKESEEGAPIDRASGFQSAERSLVFLNIRALYPIKRAGGKERAVYIMYSKSPVFYQKNPTFWSKNLWGIGRRCSHRQGYTSSIHVYTYVYTCIYVCIYVYLYMYIFIYSSAHHAEPLFMWMKNTLLPHILSSRKGENTLLQHISPRVLYSKTRPRGGGGGGGVDQRLVSILFSNAYLLGSSTLQDSLLI